MCIPEDVLNIKDDGGRGHEEQCSHGHPDNVALEHQALPPEARVHLEQKYLNNSFLHIFKNKPAAQAAGTDPSRCTPPIGQIHPLSKMALTSEPLMGF